MELTPTSKGISPEGIAVDAAIDALTVEALRGSITVKTAQEVAGRILKTEVGIKAAKENNEAWIEFMKRS